MLARILGSRYRLAWNNSGANLASGVASTLLSATDADLGLLEVDEFALPEVMRRVRPRVVSLGNLFRDQLDRYGELEHIADRWRAAVAALPPTSMLVVNADDPLVADLADGREQRAALRRRRSPARAAGAAARGRLEVLRALRRARTTTRPPTSAISATTAARPAGTPGPPLDVAARSIDLQALDASVFDLVTPAGTARVRLPLPGLYNVYNALAAAAVALALDASLDEIAAGLGTFTAAFGRFERIEAGDRRILMLLIKNPAGANEAIRTLEEGGVPATLVIALNDRIADGRDVSWIWDVDFEPLLDRVERIVVERRAGRRAGAAVHLRRLPAGAARGDPRPPRGARPRARARARRAASSACSRPTRRCSSCARSRSRAASCGRTGRRRREDRASPTSTRTTSTSTPTAATSPSSRGGPLCAGTRSR